MTKRDLISRIIASRYKNRQMTREAIRLIVEDVFDIITKELERGKKVGIIGFGTFEVRNRAARKIRNPITGEEISLAPSKLVQFRMGATLRRAILSGLEATADDGARIKCSSDDTKKNPQPRM